MKSSAFKKHSITRFIGKKSKKLESSVVVLDKRGNPEYNNNCYSITR